VAMLLVNKVVDEALRAWRGGERGPFIQDPDSIMYYPPITNPEKILCVAVNYKTHAGELGAELPEEPYIFTKLPSALIGHRWPILIPRSSSQVDHEIELGVVIGRVGKYISRSKALDYVAGYVVFNDVSFRDRRAHKSPRYRINWLHLKSMDSGAPVGPYLVTRDEIPDPHNLRLTLRVNGEVRQSDSTSNMVFKVNELIEYISDGITLKPGDYIATGTPSGVGMATGKFLREDDVVEAEIESVGVLVNPVKREGT